MATNEETVKKMEFAKHIQSEWRKARLHASYRLEEKIRSSINKMQEAYGIIAAEKFFECNNASYDAEALKQAETTFNEIWAAILEEVSQSQGQLKAFMAFAKENPNPSGSGNVF